MSASADAKVERLAGELRLKVQWGPSRKTVRVGDPLRMMDTRDAVLVLQGMKAKRWVNGRWPL